MRASGRLAPSISTRRRVGPSTVGGEVAGPLVELRVADLGVPGPDGDARPVAGEVEDGAREGGRAVREEQGHRTAAY